MTSLNKLTEVESATIVCPGPAPMIFAIFSPAREGASYQPAFRPTSDNTIVSVTTLRTRLSSFAALTLTFRDNYDSRAMLRGARVNNDGELLVGLLTSF